MSYSKADYYFEEHLMCVEIILHSLGTLCVVLSLSGDGSFRCAITLVQTLSLKYAEINMRCIIIAFGSYPPQNELGNFSQS